MDNLPVILVVEDNEDDQRLVMRALSKGKTGCKVEIAEDGLAAVQYLFDPESVRPRLVLLDLKLPKLNGLEVLTRIRSDERTKRLPVVIHTSSSEESDLVNCFDNGANSFVHKVVDYDQYIYRLVTLAEYWIQVNEPCA